MSLASLGYVRLEMQDPNAWGEFAQSVLGFEKADISDPSGAVYLRMDDAPFRYLIEKGDADRFVAAAYEVTSADALEALQQRLSKAGVDFQLGSEDEAARRAVGHYISCADPSGNQVEFYVSRAAGSAVRLGAGVSGFLTGDMGLGHLVLPAAENVATEKFYTDVVGFGISDDLSLPAFAEGMPEQRILFMHADNPRHHTLGLYNFPNPTGVIHLMAEMLSIDEVGHCMDRVKAAGLHIFASLGRHANDEMVSFYFFAPGGIGFEIGFDGKQVADWSSFEATQSTIGDIWGHEYDFPVVGE